ncbi:MAG: PH domain-containing protein [Candidatus Thorarchaeota archaeon]
MMNEKETDSKIPHEILIAKFHPRRTSSLFFYIFGVVVFVVGWVFMIASSADFIEFTLVAWISGIWAMVVGILSIIWREIIRRYTLYIITSWNLRVRRGYRRKRTKRVFYDEISDVKIIANTEDRMVNQGDIQIFVKDEAEPVITFYSIDNPRGIYELIQRMLRTVPEPYPWSHLERSRIAPY